MMKKYLLLLSAAALALLAISCDPKTPKAVDITIQLMLDGAPFAQEGVEVTLDDAAGTASYPAVTDASGAVQYVVPIGSYTASATWKTAEDGIRIAYNGSNPAILVADATTTSFKIDLQKVESQQIIIKELYSGGCYNVATAKGYSNDAYVVLYNNSDVEADATDIVFTFAAPYNSYGTNKYLTDGKLLYENDTWIPAYGAIWWFTAPVTIPAYSQIVIAIFGAIDHTKTIEESVDLSASTNYWMSNSDVAQYTNAKYAVADGIPTSQYLTCSTISPSNAWALSNSSPAFYVGRMPASDAKALCENKDAFDATLGTAAAFLTAKFPKANVVDAVDVASAANISKYFVRFSSDINTGYVALTNQKGYSVYRNVDKEATEALEENANKLVYGYAGGTEDIEGSTDPSGIDAEASIKNGAHIIFSETNDSSKDFHQRKVASLKK